MPTPRLVGMSMESAAWSTLYRTMSAQQEKRPFSRVTVRRIAGFARPQRVALGVFVVLSVVGAFLAVATPLLAGRGRRRDRQPPAPAVVVRLALLIAVIAVAEAAVGLVSRWLSAQIGEALILDLRRAVFDHVQRMPVAFFTRTRTGALVSRLNNDVIGAQRAFSDTLSGVVGNFVALVLTLVVMLTDRRGRSPCWRWCCCRCSSCPPAGWAAGSPSCGARRPTTTPPWAPR